MTLFNGLSAFSITPADAAGRVDTAALGYLLERIRSAGAHSIGLLGSTGGYAFLSRGERQRAVEAAMESVGGRIPVIVGVGALRTDEAEALACDAKAAGADETLVYGRAPFDKDQSKALAEAFKAACGPGGADVIYDPVGGDYAEPALRSIAWEGRYLVVGFPAGIPKLPLNLTLLKSCDVCGVFWGAFAARDPKANQAHVEHLFRLWEEGKIAPRVTESFAFEDGGKAIAKMAARQVIGKVAVRVG